MIDNPRVLIIEASFYQDIADQLSAGAIKVLEDAGVSFERLSVPGAFEIPAAIRFAIRSMEVRSTASGGYNGFIALGCVVRGETDHYDHISRETIRALMDIAVNYSVAMGMGVLTCETYEQAIARASVSKKNKGADVAAACIQMMELKKSLRLVVR